MSRPLFSTGIARGGTNLVAKMLNVNAEAYLAVDPFLLLMRQFRDDVITRSGDADVRAALGPQAPLDDYYYSALKIRLMDLVQAAEFDLPFEHASDSVLMNALKARASLASSNLVPYLAELGGRTYEEVFRSALEVVAKASDVSGRRWVGWHDCWAVEFFTPLAKAFPDARFLIIVRDPRATLASAITSPDRPELIPHSFSYVRNWRKLVAFATKYLREPLFEGRLHIVRYEDVVTDPESATRSLTDFLEIPFDPRMLDARNFKDATGRPWGPNSSWSATPGRIYASSLDTWKTKLAPGIIELSDLVCDPEMRLFGYEPVSESAPPSEACLEFVERDADRIPARTSDAPTASGGWRIGDPDVIRDIGAELIRRALLAAPAGRSDDWIRRCFLFREVYDALRVPQDRSRVAEVSAPARSR